MKENWTMKANELAREFIKLQIENNDYYYYIKKSNEKENCVNDIFNLYEEHNCFSIYKIMDSIENFMTDYGYRNVKRAILDDRFFIYD